MTQVAEPYELVTKVVPETVPIPAVQLEVVNVPIWWPGVPESYTKRPTA